MIMTLEVDKKNAIKAWNKADGKGKDLLENLYGKEVFKNISITDRIKTFEDAKEETERPSIPDFSDVPKDLKEYFENLYKMVVITEALNEGWEPNWNDIDERKWSPYFIMSPSSFAFRYSDCVFSSAGAGSGSRLCFKTEALANYAGEKFLDIWEKIQLK